MIRPSTMIRATIPSLLFATIAASSAQADIRLASDRPSYTPGLTAVLTGTGFAPHEVVTLVVLHQDGSQSTGTAHLPWTVGASASGSFVASWVVCGDDCIDHWLVATATGSVSGPTTASFFNHDCGDGVVTSVTPVGGACSDFTPAVGAGPDNYEVQEGGTYVMTIEGVTECSGDTITVFVQGSSTGNFCFNATGGGGTYSGTFTMPDPACNTYPVSYKCGANATCSHPGSFAVQGPNSGCGGVHLRASTFDGSCNATGEDESCGDDCCTPEIDCPSDTSVDCSDPTDPPDTGTAVVVNGCPADVSFSDSIAPGVCSGSYVITRTWTATATDSCGFSSSCEQIITVTDLTPPDIVCPGDVTVDCTDPTDPPATGSPMVSDDCSAFDVDHSDEVVMGICAGSYVINRTWTATDECGNSASCVQVITVTDTTPPSIDCPGDLALDCSESTDPSDTGTATAGDDCSGVSSIDYEDVVTPGDCDGEYVIERTWTAMDGCGNSMSCTQTITVTDTTPPSITCPPDVTVAGCCTNPGLGTPIVSDDCSDYTVTNDAPEMFCTGETIVTWTATDECGNSNSCQQTVTVVDIILDFEEDGDGDPLLHGQSLETAGPETPWPCVTITSGPDPVTPGTGNNGAAIWDSTDGPFYQDPDLDVDKGNILYLQRNGDLNDAMTGLNGPDTWDRPNDDDDGGTLTFDFCAPIQALSVNLIDIDLPAPDQDVSVTLTDGDGDTRVYTVPAGWTTNGPGATAVKNLLLNTTSSQPGVSSTATVVTDPDYDDGDVVRIEFRLGSSGAIDDLRYCPNGPAAAVAARNGSGVNPMIFSTASAPVLGTRWGAILDCTALDNGMATVSVKRSPREGQMLVAGELLIGGELVHRSFAPFARAASLVSFFIPNDLALIGLQVYAQGLCETSAPAAGQPKLRFQRAQLSNALDLTFGF